MHIDWDQGDLVDTMIRALVDSNSKFCKFIRVMLKSRWVFLTLTLSKPVYSKMAKGNVLKAIAWKGGPI